MRTSDDPIRALIAKWIRHSMGSASLSGRDAFEQCALELDALLSRAAVGEPPEIDCPLCSTTVKQVSSATLSLALWQHVNWVCPQARLGSDPAPVEPYCEALRALVESIDGDDMDDGGGCIICGGSRWVRDNAHTKLQAYVDHKPTCALVKARKTLDPPPGDLVARLGE